MNTTLFLKYRPQTFSDIVGQEAVVRTLQNAIKTNRPAHAYLFVGSRGTGKTSTARILAKGLNCLQLNDGSPCGKCDICKSTADGSLIDVIEIDAASHTGVDNIRDLREKANFMPNIAKRKIYIIDEVHMLSKGAFNALLKTLEEPPAHAFFVLATTEFDKVPETIVSRCQTFTFGRFSMEQLVDRIDQICKKEGFRTTPAALQLIARKAEGGLRDAIGLLEQLSAETEGNFDEEAVRNSLGISSTEQLQGFFNAIEAKDADSAFVVLKDINKRGGDFRSFGHDFLNFLREKMYTSLKDKSKLDHLIQQIEAIENAITRFRTSPLVELPLEIAVLKLCSDSKEMIPAKKNLSEPVTSKPSSNTPQQVPSPQKSSDFIFDDEKTSSKPSIEKEPTQTATPPKTIHSNELSPSRISSELEKIADTEGFPTFAKKSLLATRPEVDGKKICFITESQFHIDQLERAKITLKLQHALSSRLGIAIEGVSFRSTVPTQEKAPEEKNATVDDLQF